MNFVPTIAVSALVSLASADQSIFTDLPFEQARALAAEQDKLFFVHVGSPSCSMCDMIKKTVYGHGGVQEFFAEYVIAAEVDSSADPRLANELGVEMIPSQAVFREGELFDLGFCVDSPFEIIAWLQYAQEGKTLEQLERDQRADELAGDGFIRAEEIDTEQLRNARNLFHHRKYEQSLVAYLKLLRSMRDDRFGLGASDLYMFQDDLELLIEAYPDARVALKKFCREIESQIPEGVAWGTLQLWIDLSIDVVKHEVPVLAWYERSVKNGNTRSQVWSLFDKIEPVLQRHGRWSLLSQYYHDPLQRIQGPIEGLKERERGADAWDRRHHLEQVRNVGSWVAETVGVFMAAGRTEDAVAAAEFAVANAGEIDLKLAIRDLEYVHPRLVEDLAKLDLSDLPGVFRDGFQKRN